jgi:hypothetical protein
LQAYLLVHDVFTSTVQRPRVLAETKVKSPKHDLPVPPTYPPSKAVRVHSTAAAAEVDQLRKLAYRCMPQARRPSNWVVGLTSTPQGCHLLNRLLTRHDETVTAARRRSGRGTGGGASTASRAARFELGSTLAPISEVEPFYEEADGSTRGDGVLQAWGMKPSLILVTGLQQVNAAPASWGLKPTLGESSEGGSAARASAHPLSEFILDDMEKFTFDARGFLVPRETSKF